MFALQNRGQLPKVTEDEFENLMSRLRKFLLERFVTKNGEVGVTYDGPVTNIKVVNGIVVEVS